MNHRTVVLPLLLTLTAGCASYQVGARSLYAPDVNTVYVPIFESDSLRRQLGERLTEAVVKEIETKTPYKVVGSSDADSILTGRIVRDNKRVVFENSNDEPRELEMEMAVEVSWLNRRGDLIRGPQIIALPVDLVDINQNANLVPEVGQSIATSQQRVIEKLAVQIVSTMEVPW